MNAVKTTWFLFGRQAEMPENYSVISNVGYYRFYYVRHGSCFFHDNGEKTLIEEGNVYLLPRKAYSVTFGDQRCFDHVWGHFQVEGWQFNSLIKVNPNDDPILKQYIQLLCNIADSTFHKPKSFENHNDMINLFSDDAFFDVAASLCSSFVNYIYLTLYKNDINKKPLDGIIDYINANLDKNLSNDTLAEIAQYSKAHFIQEFSRIYKISPQKYVTNARMSQAITLLMNNEKIYNISYKLGYDNPKSFARAFKRETGITPKDYRTIHYLNIHND